MTNPVLSEERLAVIYERTELTAQLTLNVEEIRALIAMARRSLDIPELVEALELLHKWFEFSGESINRRWNTVPPEARVEIVKAMKAALAKHKGEAP